jgi:hypothetical protein
MKNSHFIRMRKCGFAGALSYVTDMMFLYVLSDWFKNNQAYEKCFQNLHYVERHEEHTIAHAIQTTYKKTKVFIYISIEFPYFFPFECIVFFLSLFSWILCAITTWL